MHINVIYSSWCFCLHFGLGNKFTFYNVGIYVFLKTSILLLSAVGCEKYSMHAHSLSIVHSIFLFVFFYGMHSYLKFKQFDRFVANTMLNWWRNFFFFFSQETSKRSTNYGIEYKWIASGFFAVCLTSFVVSRTVEWSLFAFSTLSKYTQNTYC